jgi:uncharacterized membrane protein YgcG
MSQDVLQARKKLAVISLLVEGNWLPISHLLVGQVGQYRYSLYSPHTNATVSIVVGIQLVGRTKVVSLHSSVWLENATDVAIKLRLHVPPSLLVVAPEQSQDREALARSESKMSVSTNASVGSLHRASRNVAASPAHGGSRSIGGGGASGASTSGGHASGSVHAPGALHTYVGLPHDIHWKANGLFTHSGGHASFLSL